MELQELRQELRGYIKRKFYSRRNIVEVADDIVNQAFLDVAAENYNFGYMSVACLRIAYKVFHRHDQDSRVLVDINAAPLIAEEHFVEEVEEAEDCAYIFESLQALKDIEQVIVRERYYGNYSFREISERHGIKINTVLSHHRRALEKLRPKFSKYFNIPLRRHQYGRIKKREDDKND